MEGQVAIKLESIEKNIESLASRDFISEVLRELALEFTKREDELSKIFDITLNQRDGVIAESQGKI